MAYIKVGRENKTDINIYYTDHGTGEPILLIHGFPFSGTAMERQEAYLLEHGYRVITYDRRGFGWSSRPSSGYDYDTFAADLDVVLNEIDVTDVTLIGHSMGTGEIARYLGQYGPERIARAVMISPIAPYLVKTEDNHRGVDAQVFEDIKNAIKKDRYAYMTEFLKHFYSGTLISNMVSEEKMRADFHLGVTASPIAFLKCVDAWIEDFRQDVSRIKVPLLVIHGDADQILPIESTAQVLVETVGELVTIAGGSHGIPWTHHEEVNKTILNFIQKTQKVSTQARTSKANQHSDSRIH